MQLSPARVLERFGTGAKRAAPSLGRSVSSEASPQTIYNPSPGSLGSPPSPQGRGQNNPETLALSRGKRVVPRRDRVRGLYVAEKPDLRSHAPNLKGSGGTST